MPLQTRHVYRFGTFSLDATTKILLRNGEPIRLARKAVETLLVLLEHPDQVLTKEELIEEIWQGRVVDEANLMQNIAVVRKALKIGPGMPGYIETFPGRGYRLLGPIVEGEQALHGPAHDIVHPTRGSVPVSVVRTADVSTGRKSGLPRILAYGAGLLALAAAWWILRNARQPRPAKVRDFERTAVARLGGKEYQPAVSPDGKNAAFVLQRNEGRAARIWLKLATGKTSTISKTGWDYASPAWSADGKALAFLRFGEAGGELVTAKTDGSDERVVTKIFGTRFGLPYHHLDWSPDGRWLALDDTTRPEEPFGIYLVSVATGERRLLTTAPQTALGDVEPRFSPDGRWVSFIRVFHRSRQGLYRVLAEGGREEQLSSDTNQIAGQDWVGNEIVMASKRGEEFQLWRVRPGSKASSMRDWTGVYGDAPIQLAVARKGHALLYTVLNEDFNIWRLALNPQRNGASRWTPIVSSSAQDASPQYSPDGAQICFRSDRTGEEQLWVAAQDGSDPQAVTRGSLRPSVGRWSPDAKAIVFNDSRETDLYITGKDSSGNWHTKALGCKGTHPVFSPDGKWIYAGRQNSIFRLAATGGTPQELAKAHGLSFGVSLDGKYIYFVRNVVDTSLWELEVETGQISKVLDGLVPYCSSCWAAGTDGIYYLGAERQSANGQAIYFHSFASGSDKLIVEYPEPLLPLGSGPFSLSPNGAYLLCVRVDQANSDVIRIEPYQ